LARLFNAGALWEFSFEVFLATNVLVIFLLLGAATFFADNASGALLSTVEQEIISKTKAEKIAAITLFLMAWIRFQNKKMQMQ
jgi:hypothetical protein